MPDQKPPPGMDVRVSPQEIRIFLPALSRARTQDGAPLNADIAEGLGQAVFFLGAPLLVLVAVFSAFRVWVPDASTEASVAVFLATALLTMGGGIFALTRTRTTTTEGAVAPKPHRQPYHLRLTQQLAIFADEEVIEMPLEAITGARPVQGGVQIEANGGVLTFFGEMDMSQSRWMAGLLAERGQQARAALLAAGEDPDKAARSPAALRRMLQK